MPAGEQVYEPGEIAERLRELPDWYFEDGLLCRRYATAGWKSSLMVANAIAHLAEAAWHHPDLQVSYGAVTVTLMNHAAKGITDKDFELATRIEALVMWRPSTEGSALEGTPTDPKYQYLKYDD